jgi:hypothetical protein
MEHVNFYLRTSEATAAEQVCCLPDLLSQILGHCDKKTLVCLSTASKLWNKECARYLWATCTEIWRFQFYIGPQNHAAMASLIRHIDLKNVHELWTSGMGIEMPEFRNLQSVSIHAGVFTDLFDFAGVSKLLFPGLRQLPFTSMTLPNSPLSYYLHDVPLTQAYWLGTLRQNCRNLRKLTLDVHLAPDARTEIHLLLLSATLEELSLGPLLYGVIDDWTFAQALAQSILRVLQLLTPITPGALRILRKQCDDEYRLLELQNLTAIFKIEAEDTLATLLSFTPNLTVLDIVLSNTLDGEPWSPSHTAFIAISRLKYLRVLDVRIVAPFLSFVHSGGFLYRDIS